MSRLLRFQEMTAGGKWLLSSGNGSLEYESRAEGFERPIWCIWYLIPVGWYKTDIGFWPENSKSNILTSCMNAKEIKNRISNCVI